MNPLQASAHGQTNPPQTSRASPQAQPGQQPGLPQGERPSEPGRHNPDRGGRDSRGRFTANNKGGPGNPFGRRTATLRQAMLDAVTGEDLQAIVRQLIQQAREGDVPAARLVFSYTLGKPDKAVDPDSLDQQEWQQLRHNAVPNQELLALLSLLQAPLACTILRAALPHLQEQMAQSIAQQLHQPPVTDDPETDLNQEPAPEPEAQPAPRQEESKASRAERQETPRQATSRERVAADSRATGDEFLADRAFLTEEEAGWLAFLQEVAAQSAAEPVFDDQQGPTRTGFPPPPSANGGFPRCRLE